MYVPLLFDITTSTINQSKIASYVNATAPEHWSVIINSASGKHQARISSSSMRFRPTQKNEIPNWQLDKWQLSDGNSDKLTTDLETGRYSCVPVFTLNTVAGDVEIGTDDFERNEADETSNRPGFIIHIIIYILTKTNYW